MVHPSKQLLILHGPNLNLLGHREPDVYGHKTLSEINQEISELANSNGYQLNILQSNKEYELIDAIHCAKQQGNCFIIINPAAFTHTSIALRDALLGCELPFIEVHLSNIFARESFRQHSYLSDIAQGMITGLGAYGYTAALFAAFHYLTKIE